MKCKGIDEVTEEREGRCRPNLTSDGKAMNAVAASLVNTVDIVSSEEVRNAQVERAQIRVKIGYYDDKTVVERVVEKLLDSCLFRDILDSY
ncbi:hypothetical protein MJD09_11755 [bacterium]|nr:hypothetical protein [bacterium]